MTGLWTVLLSGALLVIAAVVPSASWLTALRSTNPPHSATLLLGADIFRGSLAALALLIFAGHRWGWWRGAGAQRPVQIGRVEYVAVIVLVATGGVLRCLWLDQGLWVDEISTLLEYVRLPLGDIVTTYGSQNQHVLYSALARLSVVAFGEHAWTLRLPAVLFGIATLWVFWRLARSVSGGREAILATAMLAFSYHHIWFSQNARGYSALLFWTLLSTLWLGRALESPIGRPWVLFAAAVALGLYTHMTMVFVVMGQFVAFVWVTMVRRPTAAASAWTPVLSGFLLAAMLTVVAYAFLLPQIPEAAANDLSNVAAWRSPAWLLQEVGRAMGAGPMLPVAAVAGIIVMGAGIVSLWRQSPLVPIVFVVPVVTGAAAMIALQHHLWPRFFFFAAGFGVLIVIRGLHVISERAVALVKGSPPLARWASLTASLVAIVAVSRSLPYVYRPKQDFGGARSYIERAKQPGDAVVTVGVAALGFRYYAPEWPVVSSADALQAVRSTHQRTWLVYTLPIELANTYPDIQQAIDRDFRADRRFEGSLGGGAVYVYVAEPRSRNASRSKGDW